MIRIKCKGASFRRAGIQFTHAGVDIDPNTLDEAQLQALMDEPELEVVIPPAANDDAPPTGDGQQAGTEDGGTAPTGDGQQAGTEDGGKAPKATKQATKKAAGKKAGQ